MESNQEIRVSAIFEAAIHMDKKPMLERMFCSLIMYIRLRHMSCREGVESTVFTGV
jgi:hypothetical protein